MSTWIKTTALALSFGFTAVRGQELVARYEVGGVVRHEAVSETNVELADATISIDGEEMPPEFREQMGFEPSSETVTRVVTVTEVLELDEGVPIRVRRRFETAEKTEEEGDEETETTSELEGRTLILSFDDDGEVVAERGDDGDEVDDELLAGHALLRHVDALLPAEEVDEGDSWSLSREDADAFLELGDGGELFEDDDEGFLDRLEEEAELSVDVTYAGVEERDGLRCAVLQVEAAIEGEVELTADELEIEDAEDFSGSVAVEMEIEGRVWYALAEGRPVAVELELDGSAAMLMQMGASFGEQTLEFTFDMQITIDGTFRGTWTAGDDD